MKPLSERMLKEYLRHDAQYDGGLDVPAPPLERWAAEVAALEARIEALVQALPAKDAEGLARVCMSFAGEMLHKQDDIGQRFWTEQAKRLRGYAALAAEEEK